MQNMTLTAFEAERRPPPLTVSFSGDFRGRTQLVKVVRQAVTGLLCEVGCDREAQGVGMIAAHELSENLVKYSRTERTSLTATVRRAGTQHVEVTLETENDAAADEIERFRAILSEVDRRGDAHVIYQEHIASSSTRRRSELGLLRILTESAMALAISVEGERVRLHARRGNLAMAGALSAQLQFSRPPREGGRS